MRGGLAVVLAVIATVVLVLGVDALGVASDVALFAIDPTATSLSVVALKATGSLERHRAYHAARHREQLDRDLEESEELWII